MDYQAGILDAYEGEVAGAAYFRDLMAYFPDHAELLQRCRALEHQTAASLAPLLKKYDLQCRAVLVLSELGAAEARADGRQTWQSLLRHSVDTYPAYVVQFRELTALAPVVDRPIVELLTQHEVLLIGWLTTELGRHAEGNAKLSTGMTL